MSSPGKPSRWSRMGSAVRRSTSLLAISRPTTPSNADRDSDSHSITKQKVDTTPAVLAQSSASVIHAPSPIAESPQREAAALEAETAVPLGPSPLVQQTTADSSEPSTPPEPVQEVEVSPASPEGYVPPPLIDSTTGNPGAFTDDPDSLPQPQVLRDPYATSSKVDLSVSDTAILRPATPVAESPLAETVSVHDAIPPRTESPVSEPVTIPEVRTQVEEPSVSYFGKPMVESISSVDEQRHPTFSAAVEETNAPAPPVAHHADVPTEENSPFQREMPLPVHHDATSSAAPQYSLPSYDLGLGHNVWGGKSVETEDMRDMPLPTVTGNGNVSAHDANKAPSIHRMPVENPFSDPVAPKIAISHSDALYMPQPQPSPQRQYPAIESHEDAQGAIVMPLPAFHDVIPSKSLHQMPSTSSFTLNRGPVPTETDETRPLLSMPTTTYLQPSTSNLMNVSPLSSNGNAAWVPNISGSGVAPPRLHELGWLEYHLPDGTFYYVHPTRRVTTDVNLRLDKLLAAVTNFLEHGATAFGNGSGGPSKDSSAPGIEVWLRDLGTAKKGFVPVKCYVDHHARTVTLDRVIDTGRGGRKVVEEDQLDMEFRYWSFMEAHPAHTTLPAKSKTEAMDVLTWAWTDRLLPSHRAIPAPFTQDECQELMTLLRSFNNDNHDDHGIQNRIVSRILLRVALWRQKYFRPNKPLPKDVASNQLHIPTPRRPIRRALLDIAISCLCLGIPYLFLDRSRIASGRLDEESGALGSMRNAGPVFIIGACTCLVAAIVLSASVTFLSLPGLDGIARTAGLVAILFASFAMASTLVTLFKYKADMERAVSFVGLEGLMNISKRAVVMSLPLVFLAYAIIAFVTGIALYSFRGASLVDPGLTHSEFEYYTRWTVVGLLGALGGILATSYFVSRH